MTAMRESFGVEIKAIAAQRDRLALVAKELGLKLRDFDDILEIATFVDRMDTGKTVKLPYWLIKRLERGDV
jgi:hypothetical protein